MKLSRRTSCTVANRAWSWSAGCARNRQHALTISQCCSRLAQSTRGRARAARACALTQAWQRRPRALRAATPAAARAPAALPPHARRNYVTTHVRHAVLPVPAPREQQPRPSWYHHRSRKMRARRELHFHCDLARQHLAGSHSEARYACLRNTHD